MKNLWVQVKKQKRIDYVTFIYSLLFKFLYYLFTWNFLSPVVMKETI